jgi:RIO-like serine/threonine protein kinase
MTTFVSKTFTPRQYEMMEFIRKGTPDGEFVDIDQLMEAFGIRTKQAMQSALKKLIKDGVIEKGETVPRRNAFRRLYKLRPLGYLYLTSDPDVEIVELLKES